MTLQEAIEARHSVRAYKNEPLTDDVVKALEEQIAILYCGTHGLLKDVALDSVPDFEKNFLLTLRNTHQADVLDVLKQGIINEEVENIIKDVASKIALSLTNK